MKTILFDLFNAQPSRTSKFHGGGEYIKTIFEYLVKEYASSEHFIVFYDDKRFLDEWTKNLIKEKRIKTYLIEKVDDVKNIVKNEQIDVFFSGLPEHYEREWFTKETKIIGTIHGLRKIEKAYDQYEYKYFDGGEKLKSLLKLICWKIKINQDNGKKKIIEDQKRILDMLDEIICVSWHTYFALRYYFPQIDEKKIHLFYSPEKKVIIENSILQQPIICGKYLLLLGGDRWLKNSYRALKAIDELYSRGYLENTKTVLVGKVSETIKKELDHSEMYRWLPYVETEELENLYKYCTVFVYPSLNEGFGYPPIEAMKYGITCVVSAICSLPEICGSAVYYVNPYDQEEISNRILHATKERIPINTIKEHISIINKKQNRDLLQLCKMIVSVTKKEEV